MTTQQTFPHNSKIYPGQYESPKSLNKNKVERNYKKHLWLIP